MHCFFKDTLNKWTELNCRKEVVDYVAEVNGISETLPQILLHQDILIQSLLRRLTFESKHSLEALFDILEALARDVRSDFSRHFPETLNMFLCLISDGIEREPELLKQLFACFARLCKLLHEDLARDISETLRNTQQLRLHKSAHIRSFTVQALGFVLRKSADSQFVLGMQLLLREINDPGELKNVTNQLEIKYESAGALLCEAVRGAAHGLHSSSEKIFIFLLNPDHDFLSNSNWLRVSEETLRQVCCYGRRGRLGILWSTLFSVIQKNFGRGENCDENLIIYQTKLLSTIIQFRCGSAVENFVSIFDILELILEYFRRLGKAEIEKSSLQEISFELILNICEAHNISIGASAGPDRMAERAIRWMKLITYSSSSLIVNFLVSLNERSKLRKPAALNLLKVFIPVSCEKFMEDMSDFGIAIVSESCQILMECGWVKRNFLRNNEVICRKTFGILKRNDSQRENLWGALRIAPFCFDFDKCHGIMEEMLNNTLERLEKEKIIESNESNFAILHSALEALYILNKFPDAGDLGISATYSNLVSRVSRVSILYSGPLLCAAKLLEFNQKFENGIHLKSAIPKNLDGLTSSNRYMRYANLKYLSLLKVEMGEEAWIAVNDVLSKLCVLNAHDMTKDTNILSSIKQHEVALQTVTRTIISGHIPIASVRLITSACIGILHIKLSSIWPSIIEALGYLISMYEDAREIFISYLEEIRIMDAKSSDESKYEIPEEQQNRIELKEFMNQQYNPTEHGTNFGIRLNLLLGTLSNISCSLNDKTFLKRISSEFLKYARCKDFSKFPALKTAQREWIRTLHISFEGGYSFLGFKESIEIYDVLLKMIKSNDSQVACLAIRCLGKWNLPYLTNDITDHLELVATPSKSKRALASLCFAENSLDQNMNVTVIKKQDRSKTISLIIQILIPRLQEMGSKNDSFRQAAYSWMAELSSTEILPLVHTVLSTVLLNEQKIIIFDHNGTHSEEVQSNAWTQICKGFPKLPLSSIYKFFRNLDDFLCYLGEHMFSYLHALVPVSLKLISNVAKLCENERETRIQNRSLNSSQYVKDKNGKFKRSDNLNESKQAKHLRTFSLRVLANLLARHPSFDYKFYSDDVKSILEPLLFRLLSECGASTTPVVLQILRAFSSSQYLLAYFWDIEESISTLRPVWEVLKSDVASERSRFLCLEIAQNLVSHANIANEDNKIFARKILKKHSNELFESLQLFMVFPLQTSKSLRNSNGRCHFTLEHTLSLISNLSLTLGGDDAICATVVSFERLSKNPKLDETIISQLLSAFSKIIAGASDKLSQYDIDRYWTLIIPLLGRIRSRHLRSEIVSVLAILAEHLNSLANSLTILQNLNSTLKNSLEDIDYEIRLKAYEKLTINWMLENSSQNIKAIIFQSLFDLRSTDFALRQAASKTIQNFIDVLSTHKYRDPCTAIFNDILLPGIKILLNNADKSNRATAIELLGHLAHSNSEYTPGLNLLYRSDPETNFFINIVHLQSHRRSRALAQLECATQSKECGLLNILDYYVPIVLMCLADPVSNVATTAVETIHQISSRLPWTSYKDLLHKLIYKHINNNSQSAVYIRAFASVLENLDCFTNLEEAESFNILFREFSPKLRKLMPSDDKRELKKIDISPMVFLSYVHIIRFLPEQEMKIYLHRLLSLLCESLTDRSQTVRDVGRAAVTNIVRVLQASCLPIVVGILRARLLNGFHLHVLGLITYDILRVSAPTAKESEFDALLIEVLPILEADIFGKVSQAREGDKIATNVLEALKSRSMESIELLSLRASFPASIPILLSPVIKRLPEFRNIQSYRKIEEVLLSIQKGILARSELQVKEILVIARSLLSIGIFDQNFDLFTEESECYSILFAEFLPKHKKNVEDLYLVQKFQILLFFALKLIKGMLKQFKNKKFSENYSKECYCLFEDIIPPLIRLTNFPSDKISLLCLQILAKFASMKLKAFEHGSDSLMRRLIALLNASSHADSQLVQDCLRLIANLLQRHTSFTPTNAHYRIILRIAFENIEFERNAAICYAVLNAVLSRRPLLSEIYIGIDKICYLVASGTSEFLRKICSQIFLKFLLDYPLGARRLQHYLEVLISNLKYEHSAGRLSVIHTLHAIILKFPKNTLRDIVEVILLPVVVRMGTDICNVCRRSAGDTVAALFLRADKNQRENYLGWMEKWFVKEDDIFLKQISIQVIGIALQISPETALITVKKNWSDILKVLQVRDLRKDDSWSLLYNVLLFLEKIWTYETEFILNIEMKYHDKSISLVVNLLAHEHEWIQLSATRLLGIYLKTYRFSPCEIQSKLMSLKAGPFKKEGDLDQALNNSLLIFENNYIRDNLSIQTKMIKQCAKNITSLVVLCSSKSIQTLQENIEQNTDKCINFIRRIGRCCIIARNSIREICIRCLAGIISEIDGKIFMDNVKILQEIIFPCYICIDPAVQGILIEHRELAVEVLQHLRNIVPDKHFNDAYAFVQFKVSNIRQRRKQLQIEKRNQRNG